MDTSPEYEALLAVTSYAEVWIEIVCPWPYIYRRKVTSYAEVWIEIKYTLATVLWIRVTSYAEVWIEIKNITSDISKVSCHLLRGGVD